MMSLAMFGPYRQVSFSVQLGHTYGGKCILPTGYDESNGVRFSVKVSGVSVEKKVAVFMLQRDDKWQIKNSSHPVKNNTTVPVYTGRFDSPVLVTVKFCSQDLLESNFQLGWFQSERANVWWMVDSVLVALHSKSHAADEIFRDDFSSDAIR